ncbi:hypothetical protein JYU34_022523 [Plutella xylostella]|uniref:Uncharacterized protein n=1 Tax=Plutella xylostella TaxID=51655 RepID=A0ABQ7PQI8_PLUXY|nr:hypothetical protein JYU34_022523 [Plutella xylostella]
MLPVTGRTSKAVGPRQRSLPARSVLVPGSWGALQLAQPHHVHPSAPFDLLADALAQISCYQEDHSKYDGNDEYAYVQIN